MRTAKSNSPPRSPISILDCPAPSSLLNLGVHPHSIGDHLYEDMRCPLAFYTYPDIRITWLLHDIHTLLAVCRHRIRILNNSAPTLETQRWLAALPWPSSHPTDTTVEPRGDQTPPHHPHRRSDGCAVHFPVHNTSRL